MYPAMPFRSPQPLVSIDFEIIVIWNSQTNDFSIEQPDRDPA